MHCPLYNIYCFLIKYYYNIIIRLNLDGMREKMKKNSTLSEKIYDELYKDIIDRNLVSGQKLTLNMLKERFNVSHTPIREALTRLAENGLVTYYSNCGVSVTEFSEEDIKEIFQFMGELDALAVQFCKNSFSQIPLFYELEEIIEKEKKAVEEDDMLLWKNCSEDIHVVFYNHAGNRYLNESAAKIRARVELLSTTYYDNENIKKIHESHLEIYTAVQNKDFDKASNLMREHLQHSMMYALKSYATYKKSEK